MRAMVVDGDLVRSLYTRVDRLRDVETDTNDDDGDDHWRQTTIDAANDSDNDDDDQGKDNPSPFFNHHQ